MATQSALPRWSNLGTRRTLTLAILGGLLAALMSVPSLAVADPQPGNMELVSKVSARQLFATSKQKWHEKVRHAAASGMAFLHLTAR